jgi:beta-1,4-mannosyl-glycoprotein beta-1,4-N-acetylglucosaminyltransferase
MLIDCFTFFKELDILEIRLNVLDKYVDKFILTESEETFTGIPKPLYFEENKKRFEKFLDKIIHVKLAKTPDWFGAWRREWYQGNASAEDIQVFDDEDLIMISDCDEIPDLSKVNLSEIKEPKVFINNHFALRFNLMAFNNEETIKRIEGNPSVNNKNGEPWSWFGTSIFKQKYIKNKTFWGPEGSLRFKRGEFEQIHGGWHFSSCMSNEDVIDKIKSYSHFDKYTDIKSSDQILDNYINKNKDFTIDPSRSMKLVEISNKYLPEYLVENKEKYNHLFK